MPRTSVLAALHRSIAGRYDVITECVDVGGATFSLLRVRDTNALLDRIDPAEFSRDERMPYWAELWLSSIALASHCLRLPSLRRAEVLELGCGLGLAGIAAARAGAVVALTDYVEDALLFAQYNSIVNGVQDSCTPRLVDWRATEHIGTYDGVLGADIIYESRSHVPLLGLLDRCIRPGGWALFTDPARRHAGEFTALAAAHGFAIERSESALSRNGQVLRVQSYFLRRSSAGAPEREQ